MGDKSDDSTSMYWEWSPSGDSSSMINAAYSSARSLNLDRLFADALNIIIYKVVKIKENHTKRLMPIRIFYLKDST